MQTSNLINTLNYLLINDNTSDQDISNNLEELEGDSYTFLHENNLSELLKCEYYSEMVLQITLIRNTLISMDPSLWNPNDFRNNTIWKNIRVKAEKVKSIIEQCN